MLLEFDPNAQSNLRKRHHPMTALIAHLAMLSLMQLNGHSIALFSFLKHGHQ